MIGKMEIDNRAGGEQGGLDVGGNERLVVFDVVDFPDDVIAGENTSQDFVESWDPRRKVVGVHRYSLVACYAGDKKKGGPARCRAALR